MITENSGKIYRFKLDHNLGYGFAEVYDFTDHSTFDGCLVYVYNKLDSIDKKDYLLTEISKTGISLGPIRLYKFPSTRGLNSWRFLLKTNTLLIDSIPPYKMLRGLIMSDNNWDNLPDWYGIPSTNKLPFGPYKKVRSLETTILNTPSGVVTKFSMKVIIDANKKVSDYYDLSDLGTKNMFVQLVNTYYPLEDALELLKQIPQRDK